MNKKYIIKKNEEIQFTLSHGKKIVSKLFIIYHINNNINHNRYCISVSKKIGKANIRNLFKRRIKDILIKNDINNSNDYVIIVRNAILMVDYSGIKEELNKIMKGEKNEKK